MSSSLRAPRLTTEGGMRIVPIASCPRGAGSTSIDSPGGQATALRASSSSSTQSRTYDHSVAARSVLRYASAIDVSLRRRCSKPRNGKWRISNRPAEPSLGHSPSGCLGGRKPKRLARKAALLGPGNAVLVTMST